MRDHEQMLRWMLRGVGGAALTAIFFVFVPFSWMQAIHGALGMGALPDLPVTQYLARSLSSFYAFHGLILLICSCDIPRYLPIIRLSTWIMLGSGVFMLAMDLLLGLPVIWSLSEGPFLLAVSSAMIRLCAAIGRAGTAEA